MRSSEHRLQQEKFSLGRKKHFAPQGFPDITQTVCMDLPHRDYQNMTGQACQKSDLGFTIMSRELDYPAFKVPPSMKDPVNLSLEF